MPTKKGLYDPANAHDNCGMHFVNSAAKFRINKKIFHGEVPN